MIGPDDLLAMNDLCWIRDRTIKELAWKGDEGDDVEQYNNQEETITIQGWNFSYQSMKGVLTMNASENPDIQV